RQPAADQGTHGGRPQLYPRQRDAPPAPHDLDRDRDPTNRPPSPPSRPFGPAPYPRDEGTLLPAAPEPAPTQILGAGRARRAEDRDARYTAASGRTRPARTATHGMGHA